ncbi:MAG TPA: hypothetical protein PKK33_10235, partial [Candidatus Cloacimonadota bacterium]|nr:hypothetical protein [Candidatus Cloacimonadota bacterium]
KAIRNFISQCVTGKQYYYVNYTPGNKLPDFENINALKVYFPSIDGVKWTHKGPWVAIEENKSYLDVRKQYKHLGALTEEEWAEIDEASNRAENSAIVVTPDHGAIFSDGVYAGTLENNSANIVKELRIWWKVERKIPIKKSPNNYNGKTFTHFITSGKSILTSDDYYFKNGKYVNKETKEQIPSSEVEFINKEKGEYVYERAILDRYYAVILNDKYFIDFGKDKIQPRSVDDYYDVMLPVVGKTYSTITDRPYSLIWSTRDLQKLYKIIHYHRELLLAISGTRGNVIDLSQKPPDMSRKEWEYHKKLGRLYIKTTDEHGRKINNSFNQWASFDDTVTTSITYLDGMLDSIDNEISDTMGMPRQRMGVTVSTDQVGSNQMALNQSLLTTEILYYDQDLILSKAQSIFLNLCVKYCYTEDELFEIMSSDLAKDIVKIPAGILKNSDWEIIVRDNSKNEQRLNELKQLAIRQNDKGQLPFNQFLEVWNEDSLTSLIKKFEYFSEKAIEIQQMAASQEKQDMIDIEKAKIDYQNQYDMFMEQEKNKLEQAKIQLEGMKIQNEKQRDLMKARNDELKLQQERQLRAAEIESENAVELAYLENQDRHETNNEQLQALQLKLDAMFNELGLRLQQHDRVTTHIETMRKLDIEDKKAKSKVKISDR